MGFLCQIVYTTRTSVVAKPYASAVISLSIALLTSIKDLPNVLAAQVIDLPTLNNANHERRIDHKIKCQQHVFFPEVHRNANSFAHQQLVQAMQIQLNLTFATK